MLKTILNAWNIKDIRTRMLFTLLLIVIYRLGSFIPVPFVDASSIAEMAGKYDILGFLNLLSGGSFSQFTIFAMGISPYITGSIVIQLLTIAIPSLERMAKEEDGRQKIEKITRYTGIGLALVQSIGIVVGMGEGVVTSTAWYVYATIGIVCTAGTASWFGWANASRKKAWATAFPLSSSLPSAPRSPGLWWICSAACLSKATMLGGSSPLWWCSPW